MSEQNKTLSRRSFEEVWNQGKLAVIDELVAADATLYDPNVPGGHVKGPQGVRLLVQTYRTAFPDVHITINHQFSEGDKVCTIWTATGTHKGDLMGIAPTGKFATVTGIEVDRFQDGKVIEAWSSYDMLGMLQALGVVPYLTPAGATA